LCRILGKFVEKLLLHPAEPNPAAQQTLLSEDLTVFSPDNLKILKAPTAKDVKDIHPHGV
jgi:hypothetical protein